MTQVPFLLRVRLLDTDSGIQSTGLTFKRAATQLILMRLPNEYAEPWLLAFRLVGKILSSDSHVTVFYVLQIQNAVLNHKCN